MKKILLVFYFSIFIINIAKGQEPAIVMTTAMPTGSVISFKLGAVAENTIVQVDFGDGNLINKTIGISSTQVSGSVIGSKTIKIYGTGINLLYCYSIQLTYLDVTQDITLTNLICHSNSLTALDVTKNIALTNLNCHANQITALDLSKNVSLIYFSCSNNRITKLDLANNTSLINLVCELNQIITLNIPDDIPLQYLYCSMNYLTFATLPTHPLHSLSGYSYAPQHPTIIPKIFSTDTELDLSSQYTVKGIKTSYTWKTQIGTILSEGTDYTILNGKTTFLKSQPDSVFCEMTNTTFPALTGADVLKTTLTKVFEPQSAITMTTVKSIGSFISFSLAANIDNTNIQVDFGDDIKVDKSIGLSATEISGTIGNSQIINIYGTGITYLDCKDVELTVLNVTQDAELTHLDCSNNQILTLNLTQNTSLAYLNCSDNQISSLNLTKNIALSELNCCLNRLITLDVTKNTLLDKIHCSLNQLSFATLPLENSSWTEFLYAPQKAILIEKNVEKESGIDLSSQYSINGNISTYAWKTQTGSILVEGTDYIINNGKTVFLKPQTDSVYCEMANAAFPGFIGTDLLKTTYSKVFEEQPKIILITSMPLGSTFSFKVTADQDSRVIRIDFGDGVKVNKTIGIEETYVEGTLIGTQTVKIYGTGISFLDCTSNQITSMDVSQHPSLGGFNCSSNRLITLDISKNTELARLYCSGNQLTVLDVTHNSELVTLFCNNNPIITLDLSMNTSLKNLNISSTQIMNLDLTKNTSLSTFHCSSVPLTDLDLSQNAELIFLDCNNALLNELDISKNTYLWFISCNSNRLSALNVSKNTSLKYLRCYSNNLTFATLPLNPSSLEYLYAPQKLMYVPRNIVIGTEIDLSDQYLINGSTTVYTWKTKNGNALVEGTDYTISNGKTIFLVSQTDSINCEMTNAAFPDFTGPDVLKTNYTKISIATTIENPEEQDIKLYSHDKTLNIFLPFNAQVSIVDLYGKLIKSLHLSSGINTLQVTNTGFYLVKIKGGNKEFTQKVVLY